MRSWMQNINRLCVGAAPIGNECACPHLAAWKVVAVLGSPCLCSATAAWLYMLFGSEAMPWASMLPKHLHFSFLCFFFQEPVGSFVTVIQGFGAASSMAQAFIHTGRRAASRVAPGSALFWWQHLQFSAMHGHMGSLKSICLYGFQEYAHGVTSYMHLFKDQVSLIISCYLCALPACKASLWAIFIPSGGSDNFSFYLFWCFMEGIMVIRVHKPSLKIKYWLGDSNMFFYVLLKFSLKQISSLCC